MNRNLQLSGPLSYAPLTILPALSANASSLLADLPAEESDALASLSGGAALSPEVSTSLPAGVTLSSDASTPTNVSPSGNPASPTPAIASPAVTSLSSRSAQLELVPRPRLVFVATYPPRVCGIATFTQDLVEAVGSGEIFALQRAGEEADYASEVSAIIREDEAADYRAAAQKINENEIDLVSLQHEYGIFGGPDGALVLDFVEDLRPPLAVTLHTVLRTPTVNQAQTLKRVLAKASAVVVMSKVAAQLLEEIYTIPRGKIEIIPHGVPALPAEAPSDLKASLNLGERTIILSFGLLGPGKGYEYAIEAMVEVRQSHPEALFIILGATHPGLLRYEGDIYRLRLEALVKKFDLGEHVYFVNRFVDREELGRWLTAADIFITPYPNLDQIVSGTVTYAMAAAKPVVSTPFAYAVEVLSEERGVLVEPRSATAFAVALNDLLDHPDQRARIGARAYRFTRPMLWPQVGLAYRQLFDRVIATAASSRAKLWLSSSLDSGSVTPAPALTLPTAHVPLATTASTTLGSTPAAEPSESSESPGKLFKQSFNTP